METTHTPTPTPAITWHTDSFWTSADTDQINAALVQFHGSGIAVPKNGTASITAQVKRKYMLLDDILTAVRPALAACGCFMEQHLAGDSVVTRIVHRSGQFIASKLHYVAWEGGQVNNLMKMGGGLSYLRRYAAAAILALPSDEDSDATGADHMTYQPTASAPAPVRPNPATEGKKDLPWLNLTAKSGGTTPEGSKALEYIDAGGKVTDILRKYRVNKTDLATLNERQALVDSAHMDHIDQQNRQAADHYDNAPF